MMVGGWPGHSVRTITWTSEMSGSASSGMPRRAKIPASTSKAVPVRTRKRFCAHQPIQRAITLHPSCGVHRHLPGADHLSAATRGDGDLPGSPGLERGSTLVISVASFAQTAFRPHLGHAHDGHGGDEEHATDLTP